jgi:hypothetical protein
VKRRIFIVLALALTGIGGSGILWAFMGVERIVGDHEIGVS